MRNPLKPELTEVSPEMGRRNKKRRVEPPKEERTVRATFVVCSLHYTFQLGLEGPSEVRRIHSRAANGRPTGWTEIGDADLKFIVPVGDEGIRLHGRVPGGVCPEEASVECLPPKESSKMEASSGPRSEEVDPSCACSATSTEVPAPEIPSVDSIFPPVESSESREGVTVAGTSPDPRLVRRLARAKGYLADLRSDRRERPSAQGSLTADQKRIYKRAIAKKKEKIRCLKLLLAG